MNFKLTKSSLNFKVYTSPTIPASGTENDIVIISSTPMENWILSSDAPTGEPMNNGDVWIQYSVSGNVFNIMNQHDFMLAITKIYQYVSGTWVSVDARRYVGGVWDVVSSAFSASINITYPATSTCVVTNSSGQTVASDTNTGSSTKTWTATVNATGTYTVTATVTDGSDKTASKTVSITADGQNATAKLTYNLWLFDNGDECMDVTGGFKVASYAIGGWGNGTLTLNDSSMVISIGATNCICVTTENAIDVTSNRTMYVKFSDVTLGSGVNAIGISNSNNFGYDPGSGGAQLPTTFLASETISGIGLVALDVSSITGFVYPAIVLANSNKSLTVTEIYLG